MLKIRSTTPPRRRGTRGLPPPRKRDESGLTTLEWLLIVAAVAGLAALAVVLVQNVVSDTSEQIEGSSARTTAAEVAAASIVADAGLDDGGDQYDTWANWVRYFDEKCRRIEITYGDIPGLDVDSAWARPTNKAATDMPSAAELNGANAAAATATKAQAKCEIIG